MPLSATLTPRLGYSWGDGVAAASFGGAEDADLDRDREQGVLGLKKVFDL